MAFDKELVAAKLRRWEKYLREYRLPEWDRLPDLGLYMEQVTVLMRQYLDYLPPELKEEQFITASTINNYVRMKIMPEPRRKRYYRIHLAYLIVILTLKQSLSISVVSKIIPMNIPEAEVREIYDDFVMRHRSLCRLCTEQVKQLAADVFDLNRKDDAAVKHLVVESAIYSHLYKLLTEKIVALSIEPKPEPVPEADTSPEPLTAAVQEENKVENLAE